MSAVEQAKKLFAAFQKRAPRRGEIISIQPPSGEIVALEVGQLVSLGYRKKADGQTYYHEFESPRAKVFVTQGGAQILIVGGGYRLTDRGFVK
jgi:hypothetical protein